MRRATRAILPLKEPGGAALRASRLAKLTTSPSSPAAGAGGGKQSEDGGCASVAFAVAGLVSRCRGPGRPRGAGGLDGQRGSRPDDDRYGERLTRGLAGRIHAHDGVDGEYAILRRQDP